MKIIGSGYFSASDLLERGIKSCGDNVMVHETCQLIAAENIVIGSNVRVDPWCILTAASGKISLGSFIHIGAFCYLAGGSSIEMQDFSGLSQAVRVYSVTDDYSGGGLTNPTVPQKYLNVISGKVTIERHVVVGTSTTILPNVRIQEGSSIGAMSLVNRSLEPWGMYAGIPAKKFRDRRRDIIKSREQQLLEEFDS